MFYRTVLLSLIIINLSAFRVPLFSQDASHHIRTGQNWLRNGQYIEALKSLNNAILEFPSSPELYFLRGFAKYSLDDFLGAELDYSKSLQIFPYDPNVLMNRAEVRSQQGNYTGALEDLTSACSVDSTNPEIYFSLAKVKLQLKKYYAAISDCKDAIRLGFKTENIYLLKGGADWGLKRYDMAIEDYRKAISINPENPFGYIQIGSVWMDMDQPDSALHYLDHALNLDTNNVYAVFNRSLVRLKKEDRKGALEDLNKVIRLSPYNSYGYYNRAIVLIEMEDKKGAIRDFEYVSKLNPSNIISYFYRARLKAELKDYQGALEDLNKTLELFPDYSDAYYERYQVKLKLKDNRGAKEDYKKAVALRKNNQQNPDSLNWKNKDYLQSLVKLSGEFEEMNTRSSKFQNQPIDIELMPLFTVFPGKADLEKLQFFDAYNKEHYHMNIVTLTDYPGLGSDSSSIKGIAIQSKLIDSLSNIPNAFLKRALFYTSLKNFNHAFSDYDSALSHDSSSILVYFSRANTRYDLIQFLQSLDEKEDQISIGIDMPKAKSQVTSRDLENTFEMVNQDFTRAIEIDPRFYFAYYNRGVVNCKIGNYHKAIEDFSEAIRSRENFAEAIYNRGLIYILLNENQKGCEDLSRAGELGILDAYKVMKRYCFRSR